MIEALKDLLLWTSYVFLNSIKNTELGNLEIKQKNAKDTFLPCLELTLIFVSKRQYLRKEFARLCTLRPNSMKKTRRNRQVDSVRGCSCKVLVRDQTLAQTMSDGKQGVTDLPHQSTFQVRVGMASFQKERLIDIRSNSCQHPICDIIIADTGFATANTDSLHPERCVVKPLDINQH